MKRAASALAAALVVAASSSAAFSSSVRTPRALLSYSVGMPWAPRGLCLVAPGNGAGVRITARSRADRASAWSPDGKRIAFTRDLNHLAPPSGGSDNGSDVFVADPDGRHARDLTRAGGVYDDDAAWSADGKRIVYVDYWHASGLVTMRADGTHKRSFGDTSLFYSSPSLSPDGTLLLYGLSPDGGPRSQSVYVMPSAGGAQRVLVANAGEPSWSPDERHIAFVRAVGSYLQVFVANADGSDAHALTSGDGDAARPRWSPDGRLIAYTRYAPPPRPGLRPPRADVHVVGADGLGDRAAVTNTLGSFDAAWRPAKPLPRGTHFRACR